jgi:hypothetical protein
LYVVGLGKTGTTTMRSIFGHYRAAHEMDRLHFVPVSTRALNGTLSPAQARWEMRRRSIRFGLEVDSAAFLTPFAPQLRDMYPRAQFLVLVRDCFSWIDSWAEHWVRHVTTGTPWEAHRAALYAGADAPAATPDDRPLTERGLPPVGALLHRWGTTYSTLRIEAPPERTLVVRTEDIDTAHERIAAFCRVKPNTLAVSVRENVAPRREGILRDVPTDHLLAEAERYCAPVMSALWGPEWHSLIARVGCGNTPRKQRPPSIPRVEEPRSRYRA